jgi:predicted O-linked N-acetylglucosamine transferase (SPINDLY family)
MPDGWLCYDPPAYAPKVGTSPFRKNDWVTFGSFSNPAKINHQVVAVWSRILDEVANARLLIKYKGVEQSENTERLSAMFEAEGIDNSRLMLEGPSPHAALFARYNDVDIGLDPFPYSGGLTTYEALWMGVPIITVPGQTFASRHSLSHLSTIGLPELVARDHKDYVRLAVGLANDGDRLEGLRFELREKMDSSPLCDGTLFAQAFATQMRYIWRQWCASR